MYPDAAEVHLEEQLERLAKLEKGDTVVPQNTEETSLERLADTYGSVLLKPLTNIVSYDKWKFESI